MPNESDYYGSAGVSPADSPDQSGPESSPGETKPKPGEEKQTEAETALLPKSLFPGEEPAIGDLCQFKVEHVWEDEIEVSYQKEGERDRPGRSSRRPAENTRSAMDDATDAFDKMAEPAATNIE